MSDESARAANAGYTAFGLRAEAEPITPGLHVVATPIGNLRDISFRALATLAAADAVIAEDTRVTSVLLAHYGISTPLVAYHEHNAAKVMRPHLIARLAAGAALALVSDAGTPLVSDPGYKLVRGGAWRRAVASPRFPAPRRALAALGSPACRPTASSSRASCRRNRRRGANGSPRSRAIPATLVFFEAPAPARRGARRTRRAELGDRGPRRSRAN